jgi:signal peptidase I
MNYSAHQDYFESLPEQHDTAMDDAHIFAPRTVERNEVVLGVYGSEEWVLADVLRQRHLSGAATIQIDVTWLVPAGFSLAEWVPDRAKKFTFYSAQRVVIVESSGILRITHSRGKLAVEHIGDMEWVKRWVSCFDEHFRRAQSLIEWVYSTRGDTIRVPLNYRPAINGAYPWIQKNLIDYIDDYLNSDASVLILIGPPGTGKTTFIKNLIHRSGGNAKVAYDEKVMMDDGLFAGFIDDDSRFLVMEDADAFLQSRADGNTMMHKFLNVSDGLISASDKKMIFSTNLPNISDIDPALMRPGRCFDVVEFRPLTVSEAEVIIKETGKGQVPEGKTRVTLAELFCQQPSDNQRRKRGPGFI